MTSTLTCPKCSRPVAVGNGAQQAQCFGCGTVISLSSRPIATATNSSRGEGSRTGLIVFAILGGVSLLLGVVVIALVFLLPANDVTTTDNVATEQSVPANAGPAQPADPTEPVVVITDEQRQLADSVPGPVRSEIISMWQQMRSTTDKTIIAPRGNVVRNRVESTLTAIEQRELSNIAALHSLELEQVKAVVEVYEAENQ